ncbi:MAG: iron ABC transporter permease [Candidatus Altiarchaeota archaeon]|nr:iron ABC transporter permease [Candidatus Altiarchaeota archaeon]
MRGSRFILQIVLSVFLLFLLAPVIVLYGNSLVYIPWLTGFSSSTRHLDLFINSIRLGSAVTLMSLFVGLPAAFLLYKTDMPYKRFFKSLLLLTLAVPPYMAAISWTNLLGGGIMGFWGASFVLSLLLYPLVVFIVGRSMSQIDVGVEESAVMAKNNLSILRKIVFPLSTPSILFSALIVFMLSFSDFGVSSFLGFNSYSVDVYSRLSAFYDVESAAFYSIPLVFVSFGLFLLFLLVGGEGRYSFEGSGVNTKKIMLGKLKLPSTLYLFFMSLIAFVVPVFSLFETSLFLNGGFKGVENYLWVFDTASSAIYNSVIFALSASVFSMLTGFFVVYAFYKRKLTYCFIELMYAICFLVPGSIVGLSLVLFWNKLSPEIYGTSAILVLGYIVKHMIFSLKASFLGFEMVEKGVFESAELKAHSWFHKMKSIYVPLISKNIFLGFLLTFIFCIRELETSLIVYPPGSTTLPISIFILYHDGPPGLVSALSITLLATMFFSLYLLKKTAEAFLSFNSTKYIY